MEREKPLGLMAFVGIALTMISLLAALSINLYLTDQSGGIYTSHPVASLAGVALLILGVILTFIGLERGQ